MKKLRMIVTSVVVLAIVGSAFAFKAKQGAFCVTSSASTACDQIVKDRVIVGSGGTSFKYYPAWDGNPVYCTGTGSFCTATFHLDNN